ncbi:DUF4038 domain-containing protein [Candidatus Stoquefichus massiliensis]|uniref:apiosidase-like domain-containing protein n=1 Tax=Candidatus Stoquefichus massiliensis TaxID=1470350 RepID=UPI000483FA02|nr:DUF4038 domain-containing protein [Candidatus Stoquefichus massiliensis]
MSITISHENTLQKDNKPFFYLADTCWSAFTNINDEEWEYYLNYRKAQGFNTLQINILPQWDASATDLEYYPFKKIGEKFDYEHINISYFEHAMMMCKRAKEMEFELSLVVMWCNYVPDTWASSLYSRGIMPKECIASYIDIVHKTFSQFQPIYIISGDTDFTSDLCISYYVECAKRLKELAPDCLYTTHIKGRYTYIPNELLGYLDFCFYQSGHNAQDLSMPYKLAEEMKEKYPDKLLINSEPCYEEMGYSRQMYGRWTQFDIRRAAWMSLLSGANAGITYGAAGIYSWHKTNKSFESDIGEGFATPKCWEQAIQFPGAWDYGFMAHVFEQYNLYHILPCQNLLEKDNSEIRIAKKQDMIVIYIPSNIYIKLNADLTGWKGIAIDLENRYVSPLELMNRNQQCLIPMTYFHHDALYILEKNV